MTDKKEEKAPATTAEVIEKKPEDKFFGKFQFYVHFK